MTKREKEMCYDIAQFLCFPDAMEIGGVTGTLLNIIRNITQKNKAIRQQVFEFCEDFVMDEKFDVSAYDANRYEDILKMMKDDYNFRFF